MLHHRWFNYVAGISGHPTDLNSAAVFLLDRLKIHIEEGQAARQVWICIFRVSASIERKMRLFFSHRLMLKAVFLCTKATGAHTQQTQSRHTFCTNYFEARCFLPDRALRGQDQPALTAAAWNPLQQGGQGYTIPVEQQYGLDTHVDTAQLWIQADLKINLAEADLWLLPQCCLCVHLCCRFKVSLPATGPLIQQVAHLYQGWRDMKGLCCEYFSHKSRNTECSETLIYHTGQDFDFGW